MSVEVDDSQTCMKPMVESNMNSSATTKVVDIAGVQVTVSESNATPVGVTFLLPGAMVAVSEYESLKNVLLDCNQIVMSYFCNVMTTSHEKLAQQAVDIFAEYKEQRQSLPSKFSVVGHSVGGKIALMLAAKFAAESVHQVVALDPVDTNPSVFTNFASTKVQNWNLSSCKAKSVTLTWNMGTSSCCIPQAHNASRIYEQLDQATMQRTTTSILQPLISFPDANHMAYCENQGGWIHWLMPGGTNEGNKRAKEGACTLLSHLFDKKV